MAPPPESMAVTTGSRFSGTNVARICLPSAEISASSLCLPTADMNIINPPWSCGNPNSAKMGRSACVATGRTSIMSIMMLSGCAAICALAMSIFCTFSGSFKSSFVLFRASLAWSLVSSTLGGASKAFAGADMSVRVQTRKARREKCRVVGRRKRREAKTRTCGSDKKNFGDETRGELARLRRAAALVRPRLRARHDVERASDAHDPPSATAHGVHRLSHRALQLRNHEHARLRV
mmetsp:Transcript_5623/g.22763  ORF Transcript_5623/g.22763 Transcript_5623/m.22763 type:complete len:235 (+) Transcript_5623:1298-2002(+)